MGVLFKNMAIEPATFRFYEDDIRRLLEPPTALWERDWVEEPHFSLNMNGPRPDQAVRDRIFYLLKCARILQSHVLRDSKDSGFKLFQAVVSGSMYPRAEEHLLRVGMVGCGGPALFGLQPLEVYVKYGSSLIGVHLKYGPSPFL